MSDIDVETFHALLESQLRNERMIDRETDRLSEVSCLQILRVLKSECFVHFVFFGSRNSMKSIDRFKKFARLELIIRR